jgi:hypothetical protein
VWHQVKGIGRVIKVQDAHWDTEYTVQLGENWDNGILMGNTGCLAV